MYLIQNKRKGIWFHFQMPKKVASETQGKAKCLKSFWDVWNIMKHSFELCSVIVHVRVESEKLLVVTDVSTWNWVVVIFRVNEESCQMMVFMPLVVVWIGQLCHLPFFQVFHTSFHTNKVLQSNLGVQSQALFDHASETINIILYDEKWYKTKEMDKWVQVKIEFLALQVLNV